MRQLITKLLIVSACSIYSLATAEVAGAFSLKNPENIGAGLNLGTSYDPSPTFPFYQLNVFALYDYEQIMGHRAPAQLKFKFEGNFGFADYYDKRLLASLNIYATYYLDSLASDSIRPYVEGGIGLVYSDFKVEGQGLRLNFNPQAGIGFEWQGGAGTTWYSAVHAYHLSNSGFNGDNRGINGVLLQMGYLF